MKALQKVLLAHERVTDYRGDYLGCVCRYNLAGLMIQPHDEHVAEALAAFLLSEEVVAAAARAIGAHDLYAGGARCVCMPKDADGLSDPIPEYAERHHARVALTAAIEGTP